VFDDVVDAVATATRERAGRWQPATTRRFGLGVGVVALVAGAAAVLFAGPPGALAGAVGLVVAALLVAVAATVSRVAGDSGTGVLISLTAMGFGAAGGLVVAAGDRAVADLAGPHVLLAAVVVLVLSAVGMVSVSDGAEVYLATSAVAVAVSLSAALVLVFGLTAAGAAALILALLLATVPALPMLSYRMAGLPVPSVPTGPEDLRTDTESVDGRRVLLLSERADAFLAGMLGAVAVFAAGAAVVMSASGGLAGVLMSATSGLLLMSRARWFISRVQRLPLLLAGLVGVSSALLAAYVVAEPVMRLAAVLPAALVVALVSIAYALAGAGRKHSPMWGRTLDIIEILLILAVLPLAAWVGGLYGWARSLRG